MGLERENSLFLLGVIGWFTYAATGMTCAVVVYFAVIIILGLRAR